MWIKTEDGLPDLETFVAVVWVTDDGVCSGVTYGKLFRSRDGSKRWDLDSHHVFPPKLVTHWTLLPKEFKLAGFLSKYGQID